MEKIVFINSDLVLIDVGVLKDFTYDKVLSYSEYNLMNDILNEAIIPWNEKVSKDLDGTIDDFTNLTSAVMIISSTILMLVYIFVYFVLWQNFESKLNEEVN